MGFLQFGYVRSRIGFGRAFATVVVTSAGLCSQGYPQRPSARRRRRTTRQFGFRNIQARSSAFIVGCCWE